MSCAGFPSPSLAGSGLERGGGSRRYGARDVIPLWGVLRDPDQNTLMPSPFLRSIVAMIFVFFVVPGFVYGRVTGELRNDRDVIDTHSEEALRILREMGYIGDVEAAED